MAIDILAQPAILGFFLGLTLTVGLLAGSYPAFYLTGFKVTEVLKGKLRAGMKSGGIRSFLVTFQFWISIVLIICTAIVYQQLQYVQSKNLGIDKEHILIIEDVNRLDKNKMAFKHELESHASIVGTSYSNNMIPGVNNTTIFRAAGIEREHIMSTYFADQDHMQTLGFTLKKGRFFSRDFPSDSNAVVLNWSAVEELGWENPLLERLIDFDRDTPTEMEVIGVVEDFNFESLKMDVRPLVLKLTREGNLLYARFSGQDTDQVISAIQTAWDGLAPGEPLQYSFLDDDFDALFRAEQRLGKVFTVFTMLAIFIACLGLFGLSAFTAEQRTKEIGIRKTLGASVYNLTTMLSREFTRLVLIAFVLSIFPAYYIMKNWLTEFAYRIEIGVAVFIGGGMMALAIAWVTVGYQSIKAARTNPVKALRYE